MDADVDAAKPSPSFSPSDPKSNTNNPGRIRSSRACLDCSRRKVKCDGLQPCNNCSKDSIVCEYGAQKKRGPPKGCDPRGGRKKKLQVPPLHKLAQPSTTPAQPKPPSPSKPHPTPRKPSSVRATASRTRKHYNTSKSQPSADSQSLESSFQNRRQHTPKSPHPQSSRPLHPINPSMPSTFQSAIASLTARPSSDTRLASEASSTMSCHPVASSPASYDPHSPWNTPSYSQSTARSPPLPTQSSHLPRSTPAPFTSSSLPFPASTHASQHASANLTQHYLQPQHSPLYQNDYHHSHHSWPSSSSDPRFSHQHAAPPVQHYDAYPLQAPLPEYHRSSPLASHRSMLPPHASSHHSSDIAPQPVPDRALPALPSTPSNTAATTSTFPSPRSNPSRSLYDTPANHLHSGPSPFHRASPLPSSSALSSRHPVSASRLTEPVSSSVPTHVPPPSSSSHSTALNPSPSFSAPSHPYSPSSTAMPHRPSYNGSQPPSPRGPASIPRSQISSPGAHWLDYHVRPSSAAANHSNPSSKFHLEDRLPPHILQRLLDIYQVFIHPHWPIIYLPSVTSLHSLKRSRPIVFEAILAVASNTFDAYLDAASQDDQQSANPVLELLYAASPQCSEPSYKSNELRDHFVHRVKTRIFDGKFAQDISTIQAAILISVIELGCGNTSSAFQFGGIACRMALDMNLHRCTIHASTAASSTAHDRTSQLSGPNANIHMRRSGAQFQERVRVFWACFILDKILSTALDKPAQLRSAEIDTDWPSVQQADEYDLWINETTRKFVDKNQLPRLQGVKVHALSSFKAWAEVMAILERILEEVYSPQAKRDRRRTKGASDYEALLRLNDRLATWRADLPPHLKWSGTWTSPDLLLSASSLNRSVDRKESEAHRGLPPHILTMRSWYCICLILLHRPRVPKLLEGPKERGSAISEPEVNAAEAEEASTTKTGKKIRLQPTKKHAHSSVQDRCPEPAGLDICNAAAKEVCDILHVYGSSFRIRKISSSWVYLIFQSATIHAALAASKSVVAFKARQSSTWSRRGSKPPPNDFISSAADGQHDIGDTEGEDADPHAAGADAEAHHLAEAELEGSSELVKTSALYLAECVRYLKRIGPTWQSASNHVAVLRNLCIASAQARPLSPSPPSAVAPHPSTNEHDQSSMIPSLSSAKHEEHSSSANSHQLPSKIGVPDHPHDLYVDQLEKSSDQGATIVPGHNGSIEAQPQPHPNAQHDQHFYHAHNGKDGTVPIGGTTSDPGIGASHGLQTHFLQPHEYPPAHPHESLLANPGIQHMQQQTLYPINANDATFWASMPVASEGYNEWDEFFKAFNPSAGANVASHPNYHPTAAVDLITALQDPNRLLSGFHQQHHHQ